MRIINPLLHIEKYNNTKVETRFVNIFFTKFKIKIRGVNWGLNDKKNRK